MAPAKHVIVIVGQLTSLSETVVPIPREHRLTLACGIVTEYLKTLLQVLEMELEPVQQLRKLSVLVRPLPFPTSLISPSWLLGIDHELTC